MINEHHMAIINDNDFGLEGNTHVAIALIQLKNPVDLDPCMINPVCAAPGEPTQCSTPAPVTKPFNMAALPDQDLSMQECTLEISWEKLTEAHMTDDHILVTGGLGKLTEVGQLEVWMCYRDHFCSTAGNYMCWVYHEQHKSWIPWGTNDKLKLYKTGLPALVECPIMIEIAATKCPDFLSGADTSQCIDLTEEELEGLCKEFKATDYDNDCFRAAVAYKRPKNELPTSLSRELEELLSERTEDCKVPPPPPPPPSPPPPAACANLYFTSYGEGSATHKYLEIYNAGDCTAELDGYAFPNANNGGDIAGVHDYWNSFTAGAMIAPGALYVIAHPAADASIVSKADQTHLFLSNGDDGFCIVKGVESDYEIIDCIGDYGSDPGTGWDVCGVTAATMDHTLVRKESVTSGNHGDWAMSASTNVDDCEWFVLDKDNWNFVGSYPYPCDNLFFSEYAEGSSNHKYLEIYNAGPCPVDLGGFAFPSVSNDPATPGVYESWNTFTAGKTIASGGVYVIAHGSADARIIAKADQTHNTLSNGDDGYCLAKGVEADYGIIDCIGDFNADPGSGWDVCGVTAATMDHTLVRKGLVTSGNLGDWAMSASTNVNDCEWFVLDKDVWDYLGSHPNDEAGAPPVLTSCENGTVLNDWSDGTYGNSIGDCVSDTPTVLTVPLADGASFTTSFGKLITITPATGYELFVTEHFQLGRYAQFEVCASLPADGRRFQFTQRSLPGPDFAVHAQEKIDSCVYVNDNSNDQNPVVVNIAGNVFVGAKSVSGMKTLLIGTPVTNLTGFFQSYNGIQVRATSLVFGVSDLAAARTATPPTVAGDILIVSTNVLNYFTTLTTVDPNARGANSAEEFNRQAAKTVTALSIMNADLFGLIEVENSATASEDLASRINTINTARNYVSVGKDEPKIGLDAIRCDFLYDSNTLNLVGYAMLDDADPVIAALVAEYTVLFGKPGVAGQNRVPLAATFERKVGGHQFTVIVNHFKSKGSACGPPYDNTEGAGNCDVKRVGAAKALLKWMADDVFFTSKENIIIMGDLNSYAQESPVRELLNSGFSSPFDLASAHTYQFDGESGTLDYALVKGPATFSSDVWHVNADEPNLLDYNLDYGKPADLFDSTSPYRFSDHDPVLVGITFPATPN